MGCRGGGIAARLPCSNVHWHQCRTRKSAPHQASALPVKFFCFFPFRRCTRFFRRWRIETSSRTTYWWRGSVRFLRTSRRGPRPPGRTQCVRCVLL